jgi:glutathione S-transferase
MTVPIRLDADQPLTPMLVKGVPGSPYTRKLIATLRYRHIPYRLLYGAQADRMGLPKPAVELLPTVYLDGPDGEWQVFTDSTPLTRRFEASYPGRSVIPASPAMAFLNSLLEDFADEWVTKAMFHYRWRKAADIQKAGLLIPLHYAGVNAPESLMEATRQQFSRRQIERLPVIGSTESTGPLIEAGYERLVSLLDAHFKTYPYLMGHRPGSSDFALYGQLTQLAQWDPTPAALTLQSSPRVFAWVGLVEDLSGLEPTSDHWLSADALPDSLIALFGEMARGYCPVMLANARAVMAGQPHMRAEIDGQLWEQKTVAYQGKCLRWLREEYAALPAKDQALVQSLLDRTGCRSLIEESL